MFTHKLYIIFYSVAEIQGTNNWSKYIMFMTHLIGRELSLQLTANLMMQVIFY